MVFNHSLDDDRSDKPSLLYLYCAKISQNFPSKSYDKHVYNWELFIRQTVSFRSRLDKAHYTLLCWEILVRSVTTQCSCEAVVAFLLDQVSQRGLVCWCISFSSFQYHHRHLILSSLPSSKLPQHHRETHMLVSATELQLNFMLASILAFTVVAPMNCWKLFTPCCWQLTDYSLSQLAVQCQPFANCLEWSVHWYLN